MSELSLYISFSTTFYILIIHHILITILLTIDAFLKCPNSPFLPYSLPHKLYLGKRGMIGLIGRKFIITFKSMKLPFAF